MTDQAHRVLVLDDEPDICWALERVLTSLGFLPVVAPSAASTLALANEARFFAALVDAKLPDAEGIEVIKQLKELQPGLPAILISGYFYADTAAVNDWIQKGLICAFIEKPFRHEEVRCALELAGHAWTQNG